MLKRIVKQRENFLDDAVRTKNRIKDGLDGFIPGLANLSHRLVEKKKFRPVLKKLINLPWVQHMGRSRFGAYVARRDPDIKPRTVDRMFKACLDALQLHDDQHIHFKALADEVACYVEALRFANETVAAFTRRIEALYERVEPDPVLQSIPGVGTLTSKV